MKRLLIAAALAAFATSALAQAPAATPAPQSAAEAKKEMGCDKMTPEQQKQMKEQHDKMMKDGAKPGDKMAAGGMGKGKGGCGGMMDAKPDRK